MKSLQNNKSENLITFSIAAYYDPYGDGKSARKVLKRTFYHSKKSKAEILALIEYTKRNYYKELSVRFKKYKKTKDFDAIDKRYIAAGIV